MIINIPASKINEFFDEHPSNEEFWSTGRWPLRVQKPGDKITFKYEKKPIAEAVISRIEKPGQSSCGHSGKYTNDWKVFWLNSSFKRLEPKTASPDFDYSNYNDKEEALKSLTIQASGGSNSFQVDAQGASPAFSGAGVIRCVRFNPEDPDAEDPWDVAIGDDEDFDSKAIPQDYAVYDAKIEEDWRGTGLGQLLYDGVIKEAKRRGAKYLWSDEMQSPAGKAAWERLGKRYPVERAPHNRLRLSLSGVKTASGINLEDIGNTEIDLLNERGEVIGHSRIQDAHQIQLASTFYALKRKRNPEAETSSSSYRGVGG